MLAAEALGKSGVAEAADALIPCWKTRTSGSVPLLHGRWEDRCKPVRRAPRRPPERASDIFSLRSLRWWARQAVREALDPLLALEGHFDPEVRKTVLHALSSYDWVRVARCPVTPFDSHWSVRKSATEILSSGETRPPTSCSSSWPRQTGYDRPAGGP